MSWLKSKVEGLRAGGHAPPAPSIPPGQLLYAIGDIHGRLDLMLALLGKIHKDAAASPGQMTGIAFLGDYVDRGPDSRGVIDLLARLSRDGGSRLLTLKGNHEEALLGFLGDPGTGPAWAEHGGRDTLISYGVTPPRARSDEDGWAIARDAFARALPAEHLAFLKSLQLYATVGDYVFVHAGVRPGVPLERQTEHDLLWIRGEFLEGPLPTDRIVVHGHTPGGEPSTGPGRIGVDTGAYATGILTALRLQGERQSFIRTGE